jgi:hypothetical protein
MEKDHDNDNKYHVSQSQQANARLWQRRSQGTAHRMIAPNLEIIHMHDRFESVNHLPGSKISHSR